MSTYSEVGGAASKLAQGGQVEGSQRQLDPDSWVKTSFRALKHYVESAFDLDIYNIKFSFPSANDLGQEQPLDKTLIHFEIDNNTPKSLGFGDNIVAVEFDTINKLVTQHQATEQMLNWDVGIWASDRSGGVTARLEAYQILNDLFTGPNAFESMKAATDIELRNFTGGSFIKEEINDIDIFRVINMTLVTRIYSRKKIVVPYADQITQGQQLTDADGNVFGPPFATNELCADFYAKSFLNQGYDIAIECDYYINASMGSVGWDGEGVDSGFESFTAHNSLTSLNDFVNAILTNLNLNQPLFSYQVVFAKLDNVGDYFVAVAPPKGWKQDAQTGIWSFEG